MRQLDTATRNFIAWQSIRSGERSISNLTGARQTQVYNSMRRYESEMSTAIVNAFRWAMAPFQPDPQDASNIELSRWQISSQDTGQIVENTFARFLEEEALADKLSPDALQAILGRHIWTNRDHVAIDDLWDLMAANVYMQRLRNKSVLLDCVREGVPESKFGYAKGYSADSQDQYQNLLFGEEDVGIAERGDGLLVNPEMAKLVKEQQQRQKTSDGPQQVPDSDGDGDGDTPEEPPPPSGAPTVKRIQVNKVVQGQLSLDDLSPLRDEIVRTLMDGGGEVTISVTISATNASGFSESITRAVRENSEQLGLDFEEI